MIKRESSGFRAYYDHISKWFPTEIAAKHWINIKLDVTPEYVCTKYEHKWICPRENDNLDCKDCIHSYLSVPK